MAFGKKKKKGKNPPVQPQEDDDFSIFDALDDDSSMSGYSSTMRSYDDYEDQEVEDDILGIGEQKKQQPVKKKGSKVKTVLGLGFIGILIAGFAVSQMGGGGSDKQQQEAESTPTTTVDSRVEGSKEGIVINEQLGQTYKGHDNGVPKNGTGAILAFDHAYYVKRDGNEVMSHFNPNVTSYDAAFVQSNINRIPGGTTYNLEITPRQIGVSYDVILTLNIPGHRAMSWKQNFETDQVDGKYYVKTFTSKRVTE